MFDVFKTLGFNKIRGKRFLAVLGAFAMLTALLVQMPISSATAAPDASQFKPGNIISNANFYNGNAMTETQIQSFLNAMIGSCNNSRCLNVLTQDSYSRAPDRNICSGYSGASNEPASRVIFKVQKSCGISAKV